MSNPREVLHYSQIYYTQWKKNELPYKVLLSWLERELQTLKEQLIELGEEIKPSGLPKLGLLIGRDECKNAIPYLQAIIDEVKESVPVPPSQQAPETDDNTKESIKNSNGEHELWKKHYLALSWKENNITLYHVMEKARGAEIFSYDDGYFNFKCEKGCVGLIFSEAGYTDYKSIFPHIKINGQLPATSTLGNAIKNSPPNSWEGIRKILFT